MTPKPAWIKIYQLIPVCLNWSKSKYGVIGFDASPVQRLQPTCELQPGYTGFYCPHLVVNPRSLKGHGVYAKAWNWITNKWWFLYVFVWVVPGGYVLLNTGFSQPNVGDWPAKSVVLAEDFGHWKVMRNLSVQLRLLLHTFTRMVSWWNTLW